MSLFSLEGGKFGGVNGKQIGPFREDEAIVTGVKYDFQRQKPLGTSFSWREKKRDPSVKSFIPKQVCCSLTYQAKV